MKSTLLNRTNLAHPAMRRKIHDAMLAAAAESLLVQLEPGEQTQGSAQVVNASGEVIIEVIHYRNQGPHAFHFISTPDSPSVEGWDFTKSPGWFKEDAIVQARFNIEVSAILESATIVPPIIWHSPLIESESWIESACCEAINALCAGCTVELGSGYIEWRG